MGSEEITPAEAKPEETQPAEAKPETEIFEETQPLVSEEPRLSSDDSKVLEEVLIEETPDVPAPESEPEPSLISSLLDQFANLSSAGDKDSFKELARNTWKDKANRHAMMAELKANPTKFGEIITGMAKIAENAKCHKSEESKVDVPETEQKTEEVDPATTMRINHMVEMFPDLSREVITHIVCLNPTLSLEALVDLILVNTM